MERETCVLAHRMAKAHPTAGIAHETRYNKRKIVVPSACDVYNYHKPVRSADADLDELLDESLICPAASTIVVRRIAHDGCGLVEHQR